MQRGSDALPSSIFDAAVHPARQGDLDVMGLDVVARPGMPTPTALQPGDFAIRRALGEGQLAIVFAVKRIVRDRASLEAAGVVCEGPGHGVFIEVHDGRRGGRALRIAGPDGLMRRDTVLVRPRRPDPATPFGAPEEDSEPSPQALLLAAAYALRGRRRPTLRDEHLRALLEPSAGTSPLGDALQRAVADLQRRLAALPAGPNRATAQQSLLDELAGGLRMAAERVFILDEQRSTLELLEPAERERYLGFAWQSGDFPGGPPGPNEARAQQMFDALTALRPERRVNRGDTAVVRKEEFDNAMQARVQAALVPVPGERNHHLHRDAAAAYEQMRTAATAEGITLKIGASYRTPEQARANAARAGNRAAVAVFSPHMLGLAIDLNMSHGTLRFREISTGPFQNLVDTYKSPVHKWMFLRGETYGWFPYRPEPWHWEYNPPGFRERFRQPPASATAAPAAAPTEAIDDPITPPRPPISIGGSVGRGGQNHTADVRAVQARLVELRVLDAADAAAERPPDSGAAGESSLSRTIAAIERFQQQLGVTVTGKVESSGSSRTDLDRAIPHPTAAELAAVTTERDALRQAVSRGLTLTGPVGATGTGNAPDDVRAVQRLLVELGKLAASHGETPAAGTTAAVPQARLRKTIAALNKFQKDVRFWLARQAVAGAITPGVAGPGDATAALLDRISVYSMTAGSTAITFRDHVVSGATRSEAGVSFSGSALPAAIPVSDYQAQGLTADQAAALKFVSTQEGNFDAINTYDRALVSVGFIQFAGGRGLPPYLALLKARQPAKFRDLLQKVGIDVEFSVSRGGTRTTPTTSIEASRVAVLDPAGSRVLRSVDAETAIREDKRLTTALILSGRDRDVQLVQIEAAVRNYVRPALDATVSWAVTPGPARLGDLLRSRKGMAALFDRAIQEGLAAARRRFERVIQRLVRGAASTAPPTVADVQRREANVLAELERDLQAATDVAAHIARAQAALGTLIQAMTTFIAGPARTPPTLASILARPELPVARRAVSDARAGLSAVVNVAAPIGVSVDSTIGNMTTTLTSEEARLALAPSPPSLEELGKELNTSHQALATVAHPLATSAMFLVRIQGIRASTLDSSLAEVA